MQAEFFLGTLTGGGFFSFFESCLREGRYNYLIKAGPGCGKSTAMRSLAGPGDTLILCASDPDSLDGVLMKDTAVFDATAPHAVEPDFPGADGEYIVFPAPRLPESALRELERAADGSQEHRARARELAAAATAVGRAVKKTAASHFDGRRFLKRAAGIISREIPAAPGEGRALHRFLQALTPNGKCELYGTVRALADRIFYIEDPYMLSGELMGELARGGLERGRTVIICHDPVEPETVRHVILPELRLAFVSAERESVLPFSPDRRIHTSSCLAPSFAGEKGRLRLMLRLRESILSDCCAELKKGKLLHDEIERIYNPYVDFSAAEELARKFSRSHSDTGLTQRQGGRKR